MKRFLAIFILFLWCGTVFAVPSDLMTILPVAVDDTVDEAVDENTRNTAVSTPYNTHTHSGIIPENAIIVGSTNAPFTTIQSAINSASSGDVIVVNEATYTEALSGFPDGITLMALGSAENTVITQTAVTVVDLDTASGVTVRGFKLIITNADGATDYCVDSENDAASDYNIIEKCIMEWTSSNSINAYKAVNIGDGNTILRDNRITITNTATSGFAQAVTMNAAHTFFVYDNIIDLNDSSTGQVNSIALLQDSSSGINYWFNNIILVDSAITISGDIRALNAKGTSFIIGNRIDVDCSSTGGSKGIFGGTTTYVLGNQIDSTTGDSDGEWLSGGTTVFASGNAVTGDADYTAASSPRVNANQILETMIFGGGDNVTTATEVDAMFFGGFVVGTDSDNFIFDDATHGSGVGAVFLGNATIDATFTGFHYYQLGDIDLQMGEVVKLVDGKLYRSDTLKDPKVIGLYTGLTNWVDSLGNEVVKPKEIEVEYWDEVDERYKIKKKKLHGQPVGKQGKAVKASDFSYSVAISGDSQHENPDNPLQGAYITVSAGIIKNGDLLTSSATAGYLELQADDIIHSYTVAQAREDISQDTQQGYVYLLK